jgi:hypothetical protein
MKGFATIDSCEINESPDIELAWATGRARCRVCGEKIGKGEEEYKFFFSVSDGSYNPWTAIQGHAHKTCAQKEVNQWRAVDRRGINQSQEGRQ